MLIQLNDAILPDISKLTPQEWDAISNLARAAREGHHYLVVPRNLAKHLSTHSELGQRDKALYRQLYDRYSTIAGIVDHVGTFVHVSREIVAERTRTKSGYAIQVPLKFFGTTTATQPVILLCENLDDCHLIEAMAHALTRGEQRRGIKTSFRSRGGGGNTTSEEANNILTQGDRMLLVIVDSDRESPLGPLGNTAKAVRKIFDKHALPVLAEFIIIRARELENLLPDNFYEKEFGGLHGHRESVAFLKSLGSDGHGIARLHIDIKEGLKLKALLEHPNPPPDFGDVWMPVVDAIANGRIATSKGCVNCANAGRCNNRLDCECVLTCGNRMSILSLGKTVCKQDGKDLWRALPDFLREAFVEVARTAFEWGFATPLQSS